MQLRSNTSWDVYCPACEDLVTPDANRDCVWCGTRTRRRHRPGPKRDTAISEDQIAAAHILYRGGLSVPQIAKRILPQTGFTTQGSCERQLYYRFRQRGLRTRGVAEAARRLQTKHGKTGKAARRNGEYRDFVREARRVERGTRRCPAVCADGEPCRSWCKLGEDACLAHLRPEVIDALVIAGIAWRERNMVPWDDFRDELREWTDAHGRSGIRLLAEGTGRNPVWLRQMIRGQKRGRMARADTAEQLLTFVRSNPVP